MINYPFPHFLGGVSRQPENQREVGTVDSSLNCYPSISDGARKRRGTYYENTLVPFGATAGVDPALDNKVHKIDTGSEAFVMFISPDATDPDPIKIFKVSDGTGVEVVFDDAAMLDYIRYVNATASTAIDKDDIVLLTAFDSTMFINKTVVCGLTGTADGSTAVNGITYGAANDGTYDIANQAAADNTYVFPSYNDFPSKAQLTAQDYVNAVLPTANLYYKALNSSIGFSAGIYQASATPLTADDDLYTLQITDYDNSLIDRLTMPLQIIYNADTNTFNVEWPAWTHRLNGDDLTNPGPSFIGRTIDDMVFHKNRLWICADEFIVSSSSIDVFQFWANDALAVIGSDPIDETIADTGLNQIKYAIPYRSALILFTDGDRQFEVRSLGSMAPDSVVILPTTSYGVSPLLRPLFLGNSLYFISGFENYGQLYEYIYVNDAANNVASNVANHIPGYLPTSLSTGSDDVNNNTVLFTADDSLDIFVYITQWQGDQKIQNAFVKFTLPDVGLNLVSHMNLDSVTYLIMQDDTDTFIYSLDTVNKEKLSDVTYEESMDYLEVPTGSHDAGTNITTWTLKVNTGTEPVIAKVIDLAVPDDNWVGFDLNITTNVTGATTVVTATGDWSSRLVAIGVPFQFRVGLNKVHFRDDQRITISGTYTMKQLVLYLNDTAQYTVRIETPGRGNDFTYDYSAIQMDGSDIRWNEIPSLETTRTQNIIYGTGHKSRIFIEDLSSLPITLVSGEIRGVFSKTLNIK